MPVKRLPESRRDLNLSSHLPYLFKRIHSQLQVASAGHLAEFGVNVAVWRILAVLWEHGELSHRDLARLTSIEVSTLSRLSKSVQRDGLIRRTRTLDDQRSVRVALTEAGRALTRLIIPSALHCESEIVGGLTGRDIETLTRILQSIADNLCAYAIGDAEVGGDADALGHSGYPAMPLIREAATRSQSAAAPPGSPDPLE